MADATWTVLPSLQTWNGLQQQFVVYQALSIVVFPLLIGALLILFRPAWPFVWSRLVTHEHMICLVDRLTRNITPDRRFRKSNGVIYFLRPDPKNMRRPSWFFPNRHKKYFPDPFIKVYPGNFSFTGLPWDIIDADVKILEDPRYQKACEELKKNGYSGIDALEQAVLFSSMTPHNQHDLKTYDPRLIEWMHRGGFKSYGEMKTKVNPKDYTIDSPIVRQFFTSTPITEFLGYGTDIPESNVNGECHDIYESKKPSEAAKRKFQEFVPWIVLIVAVCAGLAVAVVWLGI